MNGYIKLVCRIFGENYEGEFKVAIDKVDFNELKKEINNLLNTLSAEDAKVVELEFGLDGKEVKQDSDELSDILSALKKNARPLYNFLFK